MADNESTPLLQNGSKPSKTRAMLSSANRVLLAGFLISVALSFTQVPILYVFRLMECEEFYGHRDDSALLGDRCSRSEIDAGEITPPSERTAMFGMLQGSVMLGTSIGYLLGGIVSDHWGIIRPFEIATVLFASSSLYSAMFIPYIDPRTPGIAGGTNTKRQGWSRWLGALRVLTPRDILLEDGRPIKHYGIVFLALGVFLGVLATGYAPILIQLYSTAAFNFLPTENSYLMASNSLIRGVFLIFMFPRIIDSGRKWYTERSEKDPSNEVFGAEVPAEAEAGVATNMHPKLSDLSQAAVFQSVPGHEFDISFLRWSLVADGLLTASTAFATKGWHIYLAGVLFPLASGSAPASKGVITEMCAPSERADALQAMTLVENIAMLSTLGLFGFIFSSFASIEKAYLTFFCNAYSGSDTLVESPRRSCSNPTSDVEHKDDGEEELQLLQEIFSREHSDAPIEAKALERFRSHLVAQTSDDTAGNSPPTEAVGQSENVTLDQTTSQDVIYCDAVSTHAASVTVVNQGKTHFEGTSSLWSFFTSVQQVFAGDVEEENENGDADCRDISLHQISDLSFGTDWRTSVNAALPPQEVVNYLTTSFFEHGQANYFCIHPEIFSRKLTAFYDGTHEFEARDSRNSRRSIEFISILFMVLAIGSQFADTGISPSFETSTESNRLLVEEGLHSLRDISRIKVPVPAPNLGWRFYEASRKLLPDIICSSSMASVQVCALQGIYLPSTGSRDASYNVLGLALRMAINMGLHTSFAAASLHAHVRELRNRLWWTVYVAERLYSVEMGRPLSLSDTEIDAPYPVETLEWKRCDGLIAMAQICHLLGRIVGAVYDRTAAEKGTIIRPKVIHQLKRDLEQWRRDLPKHVNLENFTTRSEAHLALTFEQATILLTRSCLNYNAVTRKSDKPLAPNATKVLEH
ncbi:hypothetical protein CcaCcLH18_12521 [Colletotrichum camelliae]|nr:hypothetical protein CcaCcLH18_12521 [Colletotrichum camelliae]